MYHDAYTIQRVEDPHLRNFNFVSGMVPFLLNLILDVSVISLILHVFLNKLSTSKRLLCWRFYLQKILTTLLLLFLLLKSNLLDSILFILEKRREDFKCQESTQNHSGMYTFISSLFKKKIIKILFLG